MGSHEGSPGVTGHRHRGAAQEGAVHACRRVHHHEGVHAVGRTGVQTQVAVRHGGDRREHELQESPGEALQGAGVNTAAHCQAGGVDRHAVAEQYRRPVGADIPSRRRGASGEDVHGISEQVHEAGQQRLRRDDIQLQAGAGSYGGGAGEDQGPVHQHEGSGLLRPPRHRL